MQFAVLVAFLFSAVPAALYRVDAANLVVCKVCSGYIAAERVPGAVCLVAV